MRKREREWLETETDPTLMLMSLEPFLQSGGRRQRKVRLFACACSRRLWQWMADDRSRNAIEVAERFADAKADGRKRALAESDAHAASIEYQNRRSWRDADEIMEGHAAHNAYWVIIPTSRRLDAERALPGHPAGYYAYRVCGHAFGAFRTYAEMSRHELWLDNLSAADIRANSEAFDRSVKRAAEDACAAEKRFHCNVLRDIFGNPFRPSRTRASRVLDSLSANSSATAVAQTIYTERRFEDMPILADALEEAGCNDDEILNHCRGGGEHVRGCWVVDLILAKGKGDALVG